MRKAVWLLNIDGYAPEITALTYPLIRRYAEKIGADIHTITKRRFPEWPVVYEKLQIHRFGVGNDWNIYIDSDALVHPDLYDVTEHVGKDTVVHNGVDVAGNRWRYDNYFRRDGRHIGSCNWFTIASDWCHDLWQPLDDLTREQALRNITLTHNEATSGVMDKSHLVDDYTLSRNIARYGLKFETFISIRQRIGDGGDYLWHTYTDPVDKKLEMMRVVLTNWNIDPDALRTGVIQGLPPEARTPAPPEG
jgi:hypothetical protein